MKEIFLDSNTWPNENNLVQALADGKQKENDSGFDRGRSRRAGSKGETAMARQGSRRTGLIGVAAGLIWLVLTVANLSPAEARMRGSHAGFRGGFGHTLHGGFTHHPHGGFRHGFHHHPFQRNAFFFNVGIGGFFTGYPVTYPYPAYYTYSYPYYYSPCGYYDAYGAWVNAPCPPYGPSASAPYSAPY